MSSPITALVISAVCPVKTCRLTLEYILNKCGYRTQNCNAHFQLYVFSYYFLLTLYLLYTIKIMLSELKMAHKAADTTHNTLDQELLTSTWWPVMAQEAEQEARALKMRSVVGSHRGAWPTESGQWRSSYNYKENCWRIIRGHSIIAQHLQQTGKVKKLHTWVPRNWAV